MIQGFTETNFTAYLSTEDNRIDTSVASTQIRFLVKLINDMNGDVEYVYPALPNGIKQRYTEMDFSYLITPDFYSGQVNLLPSGHWKYEVYEVSWIGSVVVGVGTAPSTETDILSVADTNGVVQGIVTKGILNLTEAVGTEQVQYTEHESSEQSNYVWYGEDIDVWNPADEASMVAFYKNKEGITLDSSGNVSEWLDSSSNTSDMVQSTLDARPSYTSSTGGLIFNNKVVVDLLQTPNRFELSSEFSVGFKIKANTFLGDILSEAAASSKITINGLLGIDVKVDTGVGITISTTKGNNKDSYIVITRDASNLIELNFNGVTQGSATLVGKIVLDKLGENFDGSIFEIQVYSSTSEALTDKINNRLLNL